MGLFSHHKKWETIQALNVLATQKQNAETLTTVDADTPIFTQPDSENYHRLCQIIRQTAKGLA